jgi:imidazolonepropionase-like amidohydrolase
MSKLTACALLALASPAWSPSQPTTPSVTVAFENVTVIDATGAAPARGMTVTTVDKQIAGIEPSARARVPAGARRIDGTGRFLIPGLWDMHVHLTSTTETACPALIANGVTGVRDMGGELVLIDWMRDRIERGELPGPAIFRAGPFVDGSKPGVPDRLVVWTAADGRAAARFLENRGVDYIKTHTATPRDAYFALLSESRRVGLKVIGHVPFSVTPEEAIDAGQYSIEHIVSLFEGPVAKIVRSEGVSQEQALARFADSHFAELANRMVAKGTWFDPTLIAYWSRAHQWDLANDARNKYMSATAKAAWSSFRDLPDTPEMRALQDRAFARFTEITRVVKRQGVRFLAGTDLGVKYVYPGFSLHDELSALQKAGLTSMEALQAATRNAAESLRVLNRTGTIAVGKAADLVLLGADPLVDIGNTKQIVGVMRNGRFHDRGELDALLAKVAADAPAR